jgi:hypothetical protein
MRKKLITALVAAAALVPGVAGHANALTTWQNFGYAEGKGVGIIERTPQGVYVDRVVVYTESTTQADPARMRFTVRGRGRAAILYYATCWNSGTDQARVASFEDPKTILRALPFTLDLSDRMGGVRSWKRCSLGVGAVSFREGWLRIKLQAKY